MLLTLPLLRMADELGVLLDYFICENDSGAELTNHLKTIKYY